MKRCTLTAMLVVGLGFGLSVTACGGDKSPPAAAETPAAKEEADSPANTAANTAECLRLEDHVFEIMPRPETGHGEPDPKRRAELVAQLPVEDIEQCAAVKDRKVIACMLHAPDVTAMRACIPPAKE
jgi:hypothetical protein